MNPSGPPILQAVLRSSAKHSWRASARRRASANASVGLLDPLRPVSDTVVGCYRSGETGSSTITRVGCERTHCPAVA